MARRYRARIEGGSGGDDIRVDGRRVKTPARRRYILLNKPRGYITSRVGSAASSDGDRPLARGTAIRDYIYPVGRLDYESEGLLILTSDGDLAAMLTHPSHGVGREYEVRVLGVPDDHEIERLARGVVIDGRRTAPAEVQRRKLVGPDESRVETLLTIVIHEGRNRQVRKMFEAIGHPVVRLRRVAIGPITRREAAPRRFPRAVSRRGSGAQAARRYRTRQAGRARRARGEASRCR